MKILVCIAVTPDTTARIAFADNQYDANGVTMIMNPYDEWYALVRAVEIKEKQGGSVTMLNVGKVTPTSTQVLLKGLAIGADEAVRIDADPTDAFFVATQIAEYAKDKAFDLVFVGKETIDYNSAEVGGMVAELLDAPFVSFATDLQMNGNVAAITREIEGGKEILEGELPLVISAAKGLAEQRIPNMMGIMKAKSKPQQTLAPVACEERISVSQFELPPARTAVKMVDADNIEELVRLLHEEAKVI